MLCVSETWLTSTNEHLQEIDGFTAYHIHRPEGSIGGGVSIYVKNTLHSSEIHEFCSCDPNAEICSVKITHTNTYFNVTCLYRPHSKHTNVNEFNTYIDNLLSKDFFRNNRNILLGDFNINLLEHVTHPPTNTFITTMQSNNYFPQISRPTRFPDTNTTASPSLLDQIWRNFHVSSSSGILHFPLSDHLPIFINIPILTQSPSDIIKITFRLHNAANRIKFTENLSHIDWNTYLNENDLDSNCNLFLDKLYNLYYSSFPKLTKTLTYKRLQKPWITQSIHNCIKHKFYLYKQYKLGNIPLECYKEYRNYLNTLIKEVKANYYQQQFTNFRNNTKKVWEIIKDIENTKGKQNTTMPTVCHNDTQYTNPQEIANAFNTYFSQIAPELSNKLPRAQGSHLTYLQGNFPHSMCIPLVTVNDIMKAISTLKNKKKKNVT